MTPQMELQNALIHCTRGRNLSYHFTARPNWDCMRAYRLNMCCWHGIRGRCTNGSLRKFGFRVRGALSANQFRISKFLRLERLPGQKGRFSEKPKLLRCTSDFWSNQCDWDTRNKLVTNLSTPFEFLIQSASWKVVIRVKNDELWPPSTYKLNPWHAAHLQFPEINSEKIANPPVSLIYCCTLNWL